MRTFLPIAAGAVIALSGCTTTQLFKHGSSTGASKSSPKNSSEEKQARLRSLERDLRRKEAALQDMRERNLVLEKRAQNRARLASDTLVSSHTVPVPFDPSAALSDPPADKSGDKTTVEARFLQQRQQALPRVLPTRVSRLAESQLRSDIASKAETENKSETSGEREQTGEQRLYSKVLETYRRHDLAELQKSLQFLLKAYPDSIYADNALYTAGVLALEKSDDSRAHHYMTRVVREFPRGNKAVSALFALAMIEKKRHKLDQAQNILKSLQRLYPGSPEASRAGMEAKLIRSLAAKSREG